jgi:hypothetical protein
LLILFDKAAASLPRVPWIAILSSPRAQVEVFHPGQDRTYYFPCNRWLQKSKEAGLEGCRAALEPSTGEAEEGEKEGEVQYRVTVHTTDCRGAGTDSDISCIVYGKLGDTGTQSLDSSGNDFERGQVCVCVCACLCCLKHAGGRSYMELLMILQLLQSADLKSDPCTAVMQENNFVFKAPDVGEMESLKASVPSIIINSFLRGLHYIS